MGAPSVRGRVTRCAYLAVNGAADCAGWLPEPLADVVLNLPCGSRKVVDIERDGAAMTEHVSICEVGPRDGLQIAKTRMTTDAKVRWIDAIAAAGVQEIEVGSFVPPLSASDLTRAGIHPKGFSAANRCVAKGA